MAPGSRRSSAAADQTILDGGSPNPVDGMVALRWGEQIWPHYRVLTGKLLACGRTRCNVGWGGVKSPALAVAKISHADGESVGQQGSEIACSKRRRHGGLPLDESRHPQDGAQDHFLCQGWRRCLRRRRL